MSQNARERFTRAQGDVRAIEVKVRLMKPLPPEGAFVVGPWGWGLTQAEADRLVRKYYPLLRIIGLTIDEIARNMVEYGAQHERLAAERAERRVRRHA